MREKAWGLFLAEGVKTEKTASSGSETSGCAGWPRSRIPIQGFSRTRQTLIEARGILTLATDAQARLERLHFQRTETHGYASTLGGATGTGMNVSVGQSLTEPGYWLVRKNLECQASGKA